jgi:pyruvate dehydrogenase E1 component alpha subunit
MPAEQVDGMNVLEVYEATQRAAQHVRHGEGPYLLETITFRFRGHSMADPEFYRTKDELQQWRIRDPIVSYRELLMRDGTIDAAAVERLHAGVDGVVNEAVRFAEESPKPPPEALHQDVYEGEDA